MNTLFDTILKIRKMIQEHYDKLARNEALTRYAIIDPILRSLGWDTEDPEIVVPEEEQKGGRPDYILYINKKPFIAVEAKKLGLNIDTIDIYHLGFKYSYNNGIPYFILTNGAQWKIYDVFEKNPKNRLVLEIDLLEESIGNSVRKLLALWRPLVKEGIEAPKALSYIKEASSSSPRSSIGSLQLDLNKVLKFYKSLNPNERVLLEVVYDAWKKGEILTKDELLRRMSQKGVKFDRKQFTGLKSSITRKAKKLGIPAPLPSEKDLGPEYADETKRYRLKDEWGFALSKILE